MKQGQKVSIKSQDNWEDFLLETCVLFLPDSKTATVSSIFRLMSKLVGIKIITIKHFFIKTNFG